MLTVATAATLVGLGATACQTGTQAAAPPATPTQTTGSFTPVPAVTPVVTPTSGAATGTTAAPVRQLKFPNTDLDVRFVKYDTKNKLVEFQKVTQAAGSRAANLVPDPKDPGIHELPMKPGTTIESVDPQGFSFETCPPTSCTADDVMASVIGHLQGSFWAHIHVNASDQIDSVRQSAY